MALNKMDIVDVNLNTGNIHRSFLSHTIGLSDNNADSFGVKVFRDGNPVDLSGGWVQGFFRNPIGENIALTNHGTISGNTAYVTLPQACYNYDGQFTLAIKIVSPGSTNTVTMRIVDGTVDNTNTGGAVAPTETVPTYQEILATYEDMLAATTAATTAATNVGSIVAAAYSTSATYAVGDYCTKDGNLYRCTTAITTAESWTAAHWTQTKMGPDVSDLKSAIDAELSSNISITVGDMEEGKFINQSNGQRVSDSDSACTGLISVIPGSKVKVSNCFLTGNRSICAYDSTNTFISPALVYNTTKTEMILDIPTTAYYIKITCHAEESPVVAYASLELKNIKALKEYTENAVSEINAELDDVENTVDSILESNVAIETPTMTSGKYVSGTNGTTVTDAESDATGFVSVRPGSIVTIGNAFLTGNRSICCYDYFGDFVSALATGSYETKVTVNIPTNAYSIRVTAKAGYTPTIAYADMQLKMMDMLKDNVFHDVPSFTLALRTDGKYVSGQSGHEGQLVTDSDSAYSEYIPVIPGSKIRVYKCFVSGNRSICSYDAGKNYLTTLAMANTDVVKELDIPANAFYIRITTKAGVTADVEYVALELDKVQLLFDAIHAGNKSLTATMTDGKYINGSNGNAVTDSDSAYSDFIEVEPKSIISIYGCFNTANRSVCCYNVGKEFVSKLTKNNDSSPACIVRIPDNAKYIRITGKAGKQVYLCYESIVLDAIDERLAERVDSLATEVDELNLRIDNLDLENVETVVAKINEIGSVNVQAVENCLLEVDSLKRVANGDKLGTLKSCVVSFLNDDGSTGQYTDLYPIMYDMNCPYSQAIYTGQHDIQTVEMMQNIIALGGDIGSHTVTHAHLMQLTEAELVEELRDSKLYFTSRGIPCNYIVYPNGESNDLVRMVAKRYYDFGVSTEDLLNTYPIEDFAIKRITLGAYAQSGKDTYEYYKGKLDEAIAANEWIVYMLHSNSEGFDATQKQALRDIITYARSQNVPILSMGNAYKIFGNAIKIGDNSTGTSGRGSNSKHFTLSKWGDFSTNIFTWSAPM